jgi:hypothetical protein
MNADEIRAEVIAVAAKEIASWESDPSPNSRHFNCGEGIADALAEAGLLPVGVDEGYIGRGRRRHPRYVGEWSEVSE